MRKRTAVFLVDGSNLHAATKSLGFSVDYKKLLDTFDGDIFKAYYFTALPPEDEQSTLRPMIDYLEFNGFTVIQKTHKEFNVVSTFTCDDCGKDNTRHGTKIKGNMDIEIAVIAKEVATVPGVTDIVLFSGDGDFRFLVEALQRQHGIFVTVISTIKTKPMFCADALRRQCDDFVDLADIRATVERVEDTRRRRGINMIGD